MKSKIVTLRLNADEQAMLAAVCQSQLQGDRNASEMFRLLLHREYNRRHGLGAPTAPTYQTDFRNFRPSKA